MKVHNEIDFHMHVIREEGETLVGKVKEVFSLYIEYCENAEELLGVGGFVDDEGNEVRWNKLI